MILPPAWLGTGAGCSYSLLQSRQEAGDIILFTVVHFRFGGAVTDFYIPTAKARICLQLVLQLMLLQSQLFTCSIPYSCQDPGLMPAL